MTKQYKFTIFIGFAMVFLLNTLISPAMAGSSQNVLSRFLLSNPSLGSITRNATRPYGNLTSLGSNYAQAQQTNAFSLMNNITSSGFRNFSSLVSAAGLNPNTLGMKTNNVVNNSIIGLANSSRNIQSNNLLSNSILSAAGMNPNYGAYNGFYNNYSYRPYNYSYNPYYSGWYY